MLHKKFLWTSVLTLCVGSWLVGPAAYAVETSGDNCAQSCVQKYSECNPDKHAKGWCEHNLKQCAIACDSKCKLS